MTAFATSLEAANLRLYPIGSPLARIRDAVDAARARHHARKGYRYLLDSPEARRDVGLSIDEIHRALDDLR